MPGTGRRQIQLSKNPISPPDLDNLQAWKDLSSFIRLKDPEKTELPYKKLTVLPDGYGFDKFGLLVHRNFACEDYWDDEESNREAEGNQDKEASNKAGDRDNQDEVCQDDEEGSREDSDSSDRDNQDKVCTDDETNSREAEADQDSEASEASDQDDQDKVCQDDEVSSREAEGDRVSEASNEAGDRDNRDECSQGQETTRASRRLRRKDSKPLYIPPIHSGKVKKQSKAKSRYCLCLRPMLDCPTEGVVGMRSLIRQLIPHRESLCYWHLRKFAEITSTALVAHGDGEVVTEAYCSFQKPILTLRRSASDNYVSLRVPTRDEAFLRQVLKEIGRRQDVKGSHGGITNKLIRVLLTQSKMADDGTDVHFWSGSRASVEVESGNVSIPIVVESQQPFQWSSLDRPIKQLFQHMRGFHREVSVQIPSRNGELESFESRTLHEVRERFLKNEVTKDSWNVLDLHNPLPATLPAFLMGENCRLLSRVRDMALMGNSTERPIAAVEPGKNGRMSLSGSFSVKEVITQHRIWIAMASLHG
ncbi:hypothetical protein ACJ73_07690 [Blastomyces percursus]|uniref:Uncharacterized protein n=1 Tax=Blastomyces percursus TaxID=1658174 RepID=A0A1J9PX97_9EURO|nr:hypothetical protein ACJ73_07690 [Blastomyces percursus]